MSKKSLAAGIALALSVTVVAFAPADAASSKVSIYKIGTKKVAYKKSITVKPRVKHSGQVKINSKKLTVKKGKKTVAKNKTSVRLKAGTYKVKTTVKYRAYSYRNESKVAVRAGQEIQADYYEESGPAVKTCTVTELFGWNDYEASCVLVRATTTPVVVRSADMDTSGVYDPAVGDVIEPWWITAPEDIYANQRVRKYGKLRTTSRSQTLKVKQGAKPRGCARKSDFNRVKSGQSKSRVATIMGASGKQYYYSSPFEGREYKTCDSDQYMSVAFEDGYAYDKTFYDFG